MIVSFVKAKHMFSVSTIHWGVCDGPWSETRRSSLDGGAGSRGAGRGARSRSSWSFGGRRDRRASEGAGPPVPASGMGTQAALDNPRCRHDDPKYGPYGRFDSTELGGASACVKEWKAGADNGGATSQGVTKDKITVVAVIPNDQQKASDPVAPKQRAGGAPSSYQNSLYDYMLPQMRFFETWGRDIEVKFVTSSGNDEAAQRADLVAIKAMKPFAAMVYAQPPAGLPPLSVLEGGLAQAKILVIGYAATARETNAQEPYRWNTSDSQAGAVNSAEVIGKQLVGKKAQYGGDDVKSQTRTFGVVYDPEATDYAGFTSALAKYKVKVTTPIQLSSATDPTQVQTQVGTTVTKLKAAGVTTVVIFSGYLKDMMNAADEQDGPPSGSTPASGSPISRSSPAATRSRSRSTHSASRQSRRGPRPRT